MHKYNVYSHKCPPGVCFMNVIYFSNNGGDCVLKSKIPSVLFPQDGQESIIIKQYSEYSDIITISVREMCC